MFWGMRPEDGGSPEPENERHRIIARDNIVKRDS